MEKDDVEMAGNAFCGSSQQDVASSNSAGIA